MPPLNEDRNTYMQDGEVIGVPVAANAVCYAGGLAAADANGFAAPGSVATTLTYLGRFEERKDNTGGIDGAITVLVRRKKVFQFKNSASDAVTQASLGKVCYIEDDETVSATNGANTRSAAGIVIGITSNGVWIE